MPMGTLSAVSYAVTNTRSLLAGVSYQVVNAARPSAAVDYTVSRAVLDAWEAPSLWFSHEVWINGVQVPDAELVGALEIEEPGIDTHTGHFSFGLRGKKWSPFITDATFSRATQVTVYLNHGLEGAVIEASTPQYSGYVLGCDVSSPGHEPIIRVKCSDAFGRYDKFTTCEEIEPWAGLTRMGITQLLAGAAPGINYFDGPDGDVYDKSVQAINKRLPDVLKALWEPKGCRIYMRGFDTLVVDQPRIKLAPEAPDHVWHKGDLQAGGLSAIPPEECPSRWVVRGTMPVVVNEAGIETTTSDQTIEDIYAPVTTTQQQNGGTGVITSTGRTPGDPVLRPVRRLKVTTQKRGGLVISKQEEEWAWKNPLRARLVTHNGAAGSAGSGFDYMPSLIDEGGEFVTLTEERFQQTLDRRTLYVYDGDSNLTNQTVTTNRWGRITKAVRHVGDSPTATTINSSYVYSDDQSYSTTSEVWGLYDQVEVTYTYATPAPGPMVLTTQDTYGYGAIRSRVTGPSSSTYRILYNGTGQFNEDIATWRQLQRTASANYLSPEKLIVGKNETTSQYAAPEKTDGTYDWGGGLRSDAQFQTFQVVHSEPVAYSVVNEGQIEEVTYPPTGGRVPRLILGQLPTTLYQHSAWTKAKNQPFEELLEDPSAELWFGFSREAGNNDSAQSPEDARNLITVRRRARICPKLEVTRPWHQAGVGDTIYFSSPDDGIADRGIITRKSGTWSNGMPMAKYRIEFWKENVAA